MKSPDGLGTAVLEPPPGRSPVVVRAGRTRGVTSPGRGWPIGEIAARLDARVYQISALSLLLVYGMWRLDLDIDPARALAIVATGLLTQLVGTAMIGLPRFDPKSALISGLSLCLLLRTDDPRLAVVAAIVAVGSKFVLRVRGKHVFNPTNLALVAMMLATGRVWASPGQWGGAALFAFALASAGSLVVSRAGRADVTSVFLVTWTVLLIGRALWLGDPLAIPLHRLQNGALVLFAFFMISDPRTTPDSRAGRVLFAILVAAGGYVLQFKLFWTNGPLWSLAACSLAVPLIDRLLPAARHRWLSAPAPGAMERTAP
jgi:Na+-translocating ferredoxin:NAD+ oxidoreductase RnfD subunit